MMKSIPMTAPPPRIISSGITMGSEPGSEFTSTRKSPEAGLAIDHRPLMHAFLDRSYRQAQYDRPGLAAVPPVLRFKTHPRAVSRSP
jgi:hypothetical protein